MSVRTRNLIPVFVFVVVAACQGAAPSGRARPFEGAREIGAWVELWNTYNLDGVDSLFLNDTALTYFSSEREGLITGIDDVRSHYAGFGFVPGGSPPSQELWVEDVHTSAFGSSAIVNAIWFFGDRTQPPDSIARGPMTAVYVATGGGYRIAHMHFANYPGR